MAKQRRPRPAPSNSKPARVSGRSQPSVSGRSVPAFIVLALVAVGGYLLYRYTLPSQHGAGPTAGSEPAPAGRPAAHVNGQASPSPHPAAAPALWPPVPASPVPEAPFGESEDVFETGAKVYVARCAGCHGTLGAAAARAPAALQIWDPHASAVNQMVAHAPGTLYLQIAGGIPATHGNPGMPGYGHLLSETQMWDLALLLRNARQELPDPVLRLLKGGARH